MKTAMQELIEDLKAEHSGLVELVRLNKESGYQPDYAEGGMGRLQYAIAKATELLDKEKQNILDARTDGFASTFIAGNPMDRMLILKGDNETYYTKTYNQELNK